MKKVVISSIIGLCILFTLTVRAQNNVLDNFYQYMGSKIKYPEKARLTNLQGKSIVLFTLSDGKLSKLKIETELGKDCDVEVLNTLMAYQNFKPIKNGQYALITTFKLTGITTALENENAQVPEGFEALKLTVMAPAAMSNVAIVRSYGQSAKTIVVNNPNPANTAFHSNSTDPKVYIDSVEVEYDELKYMDPSSIKSIHIYKGVSSIANYGPAAINGVIAIITKSEEKLPFKKETPANKQN